MGNKYFKSAVVGGFDRRDVLLYVENQVREHRAEIERLSQKLKDAVANNEILQRQNDENIEKISRLEEQNAANTAELDRAVQSNSFNETRLSETKAALSEKESEIDRLKSSLAEKDAEKILLDAKITEQTELIENIYQKLSVFEASRQRVADIELAAFRRAEEIEKAAIANAEKARSTLRKLMLDAKTKYEAVRADTEATTAHIYTKLDSIKEEVGNLNSVMDLIGERIETLGYHELKPSSYAMPPLEPLEDDENPDTDCDTEENIAVSGDTSEVSPEIPEESSTPDEAVSSEIPAKSETSAVSAEPVREYFENPLMAGRTDLVKTQKQEDEDGFTKPVFEVYTPQTLT